MLVLGSAGSVLASFWLSGFWIKGSVLHSDFLEYCTGTSAPFVLTTGISSKRSMLPMILPRMLYEQWGVFDALAIASIISLSLSTWCIAIWARIIGGRTAGYVALFSTLCLGPLCLTGHFISSYPEMSLCFVLGAMTTSLAITFPRHKTIALAGIGIGLTLLADARGLLWGLSYIGLLCLRILFHRKRISLFLVLFGILYVSWLCGRLVYIPEAIGLEEQVDFRPMIHTVLGEQSPYSPPFRYSSRWVWGLVPPQEARHTLKFLYEQTLLSVPSFEVSDEIRTARTLGYNYFTLSLISFALVICLLWKHPTKLLALGTCIPFLLGLYGSLSMLENHARFFLNTLPALALLLALCWSQVGIGKGRWKTTLLSISLWLGILLGILPSPLSPTAQWQHRFSGSDPYFSEIVLRYKSGEMTKKQDLRHCFRALQSLELDKRPLGVDIYRR